MSAIEDKSHIDSELISAHCGVLKISSEVTSAVLKYATHFSHVCVYLPGGRKLDAKPDWEEFVALASTLLGQDFISSVEAMFDIFGGEEPGKTHPHGVAVLTKPHLLKLLHYIGKHDPAISAEFIKCIEHALRYMFCLWYPLCCLLLRWY